MNGRTDGHVNYVMMSAGDVGDSSIMFLIMEAGERRGREGCQVERRASYLQRRERRKKLTFMLFRHKLKKVRV